MFFCVRAESEAERDDDAKSSEVQKIRELRQHVAQRLGGERRLGGLVARTIQTDHQAIAHQGVVTDPGEGSEVANTLGLCRHRQRNQQAQAGQPAKARLRE